MGFVHFGLKVKSRRIWGGKLSGEDKDVLWTSRINVCIGHRPLLSTFVAALLCSLPFLARRLGHHKAAVSLKKQFSVTEKRFAWAKIRTHAEAHDWEGLETYAQEIKRSPVG
jgi:hypothetical protein